MGGKWVSFNQLTERYEYLHLTQHTKSIFMKKWGMLSTRLLDNPQPGGGQKLQLEDAKDQPQLGYTPGAPASSQPGQKGQQQQQQQQLEKKEPGPQEPAAPKGSKRKASDLADAAAPHTPLSDKSGKTILDMQMSKAYAVKRRYLTISGQASAFLAQAQSDEQFQWMSQPMLQPVQEAQKKLSDQLTPFFLHLVSGVSMQGLKKQYQADGNTLEELEEKLRHVSKLKEPLDNLHREVERLLRMHAARGS